MSARRILGVWVCLAALLSVAFMVFDTISGHCGVTRLFGEENAIVALPSMQEIISFLIADWRFHLILFGALSLPGMVAAFVSRITQPSRAARWIQLTGLTILFLVLGYALLQEIAEFDCETTPFHPDLWATPSFMAGVLAIFWAGCLALIGLLTWIAVVIAKRRTGTRSSDS